jgi:hypothetical protein
MSEKNTEVKTRRPRTALKGNDPEKFQSRFNALVKQYAVKNGEKPDMSKGYIKVDKTRQEIVEILKADGHEFIMQKQGDSEVNGTLNSLVGSYAKTLTNTIVPQLKTKLLKDNPEYVNFGSFHQFLVDKSKSQFGQALTWSQIHEEDPSVFRTWAEEFIQDLEDSPTQILKFNADSRGRTRQVDSDFEDLI